MYRYARIYLFIFKTECGQAVAFYATDELFFKLVLDGDQVLFSRKPVICKYIFVLDLIVPALF